MSIQKPAAQQQMENMKKQEELKNNNVKGNDTMENIIMNNGLLGNLEEEMKSEVLADNEYTRVIAGENTEMLYAQLNQAINLSAIVDRNGGQIIRYNPEEGTIKYQVNALPTNIQYMLNVFFNYTVKEENGLAIVARPLNQQQLEEIQSSTLNVTCDQDKATEYAKFYFSYNGIGQDRLFVYNIASNGAPRVEIVAFGLTQEEMKTILTNSKNVARRKAFVAKTSKVGQATKEYAVTGAEMAGAVAVEAARTLGAVGTVAAKTVINSAMAFGSELLKGADELKNMDLKNNQDVKNIAIAWASLTNKSNTSSNKVTGNTLSSL